MKFKPVKSFAGGSFVLLPILIGCGSVATLTPTPVAPTALNGNWLITGDMPDFLLGFTTTRTFGIAANLDAINGEMYATVADFYPCTGLGATGSASGYGPASIASDGSFTLQSTSGLFSPTTVLTIHGNIPTASGSWSGTYSATNSNSGCSPVSGSFTAIPVSPVTGTFAGTGSLGTLAPNATIIVALRQGGPSTLDPPSNLAVLDSVNALTGSVNLQGTPCATNGTMDIPAGVLLGNDVATTFTMSDGSRLSLRAFVDGPAVSSIHVESVLIAGGPCDKVSGFINVNLAKQ